MQSQTTFDYKFNKLQLYIKRYLSQAKNKFDQKLQQINKQDNLGPEEASMSYWEKYLAGILDNIQVSIKNIHIRLEDRKESIIDDYVLIRGQYTTKKTKVYKNMCIGATIKEISLKTLEFGGEII